MKGRVASLAAVLCLSGLLCGCGGERSADPDLVVRNESRTPLGSITITGSQESQSVAMGRNAPMERGDSFAFAVKEGPVLVELWDARGAFVGRCQVELQAEGATVTVQEDLDLEVEHGT